MAKLKTANAIARVEQIQRANWSKLKDHIDRLRAKIEPGHTLVVVPAGKLVSWNVIDACTPVLASGGANKAVFKKVFDTIEQACKREVAATGKIKFDDLVTVLKRLKAPSLIGPDFEEKRSFTDLAQCAFASDKSMKLSEKAQIEKDNPNNGLLPVSESKELWPFLSGIYVTNASAEMRAIDEVLDAHGKLNRDKATLLTELRKALKNAELDEPGRKKIQKLMDKFCADLFGKAKRSEDTLLRCEKQMMKSAKKLQKAPG
jgi:hypothetical protein